MALTADSTLKEIMENATGKAIMEKHVPGISSNSMLKMALPMTLKKISSIPPAGINAEKLQAIVADLAKL